MVFGRIEAAPSPYSMRVVAIACAILSSSFPDVSFQALMTDLAGANFTPSLQPS
jgi:hypothetical protein